MLIHSNKFIGSIIIASSLILFISGFKGDTINITARYGGTIIIEPWQSIMMGFCLLLAGVYFAGDFIKRK